MLASEAKIWRHTLVLCVGFRLHVSLSDTKHCLLSIASKVVPRGFSSKDLLQNIVSVVYNGVLKTYNFTKRNQAQGHMPAIIPVPVM